MRCLRGRLTICLLGAVLATGCEGPPRVSHIDHIDLWTPQVTANLDRQPGSDGVQALVFLYDEQGGKPRTVLADGNLEVMLYEGSARRINPLDTPLRTWTYSPEQLKQLAAKRSGLWCYPLMLTWGDAPPKQPIVSLLVRYVGRDGRVVYSRPVVLPSGVR